MLCQTISTKLGDGGTCGSVIRTWLPLAYCYRRSAYRDATRSQSAPNHGVSTYHAPFPDHRTGQHRHPAADPYVGSNIDRPTGHCLLAYRPGVSHHAVVRIANRGILANLHVISEAYCGDGRDKNILGQRDSASHLKSRSCVNIKARTLADKYVVAQFITGVRSLTKDHAPFNAQSPSHASSTRPDQHAQERAACEIGGPMQAHKQFRQQVPHNPIDPP